MINRWNSFFYAKGKKTTVIVFINRYSLIIASRLDVVVISSILSSLLCKLKCLFKNHSDIEEFLSFFSVFDPYNFEQLDFD